MLLFGVHIRCPCLLETPISKSALQISGAAGRGAVEAWEARWLPAECALGASTRLAREAILSCFWLHSYTYTYTYTYIHTYIHMYIHMHLYTHISNIAFLAIITMILIQKCSKNHTALYMCIKNRFLLWASEVLPVES